MGPSAGPVRARADRRPAHPGAGASRRARPQRDAQPDALTPVEQEELPADEPVDDLLAGIGWPSDVAGCALVHEVLVLPPSVEAAAPTEGDVAAWAAAHPERREVRMVVGVLRDGSRASLLRVRATDAESDDLLGGADLVPRLAEALLATLQD